MEASSCFCFPLDVERVIMETAARQDKQTAVQLALVAKRVQAWVEPIIYEVVYLDNPVQRFRFLSTFEIDTKPISFYQHAVKALYLTDLDGLEDVAGQDLPSDMDCARLLLPVFTGVTDLFCCIRPSKFDPELGHAFAALRPKRLSAHLTDLLYDNHNYHTPNFSIPFFSQTTHLEIIDSNWPIWDNFSLMPCLTHLRVPLSAEEIDAPQHAEWSAEPALRRTLARCARLLVCVVEINHWGAHGPLWDLHNDYRLVWTVQDGYCGTDWKAYRWGQRDTWDFANDRVARQKQLQRCLAPCVVYEGEED